jgi:hypothetical protein
MAKPPVLHLDIKKLNRFLLNPQGKMLQAMKERGERVRKAAVANLSGQTSGGRQLARSIKVQIEASRDNRSTLVRVIATAPHAKFVEEGTQPTFPNPDGKPPVKNLQKWADHNGVNVYALQNHIWHHGTPAKHYMLRALRSVF